MQIAIIAPGSRGDVQPYIALGKGLKNAGHAVRIVTHGNFEALVAAHGLDCVSDKVDVQKIAESDAMRRRLESGNFLLLMAQMAKEAERQALHLSEAGLAACHNADLIIAGMGGLYTGLALAEKLHIPILQAHLIPFTPTGDFASPAVPPLAFSLGRSFNRLTHHLLRQLLWQGFRSADELARTKLLGLPAAPFSGPYRSAQLQGLPILYGISPSVIPPPSDWTKDINLTGYWFLDEETDWAPPQALADFLKAGPPPVYIGFGSMSNRKPEEVTDLVLKALRQINQRAILLSGWAGLQKANLPDSIFMIDSIPHSWLFPRVAAIVHHGGAGTTAASLRAGIPTLVVPFFGDQPFWGQRMANLGVGPKPISRNKLTVDRLAQAIQQSVTDTAMRQRATALGDKIKAEDGIARAVEIVSRLGK